MTTATPPIQTGPLGRWRLTRKERHNLVTGLLFISPWIVGFLAFLVYPIFYTIRISFTQYSGFGEPVWTGLDNYRALLNDEPIPATGSRTGIPAGRVSMMPPPGE